MNKFIETDLVAHLRGLYEVDEDMMRLMDWAAERKNDTAETSIDLIMKKIDVNRRSALNLAKSLELMGAGTFLHGRKGHKSRIRWNYSLRSLGEAARGGSENIEDIDPDLSEDFSEHEHENLRNDGFSIQQAKVKLAKYLGIDETDIQIIIRS